MSKDISTIIPSLVIQFYCEVMIKAMGELEAKIENQEAKIETLTQLLNKVCQNSIATPIDLSKVSLN